jgi:hypothetical protein
MVPCIVSLMGSIMASNLKKNREGREKKEIIKNHFLVLANRHHLGWQRWIADKIAEIIK